MRGFSVFAIVVLVLIAVTGSTEQPFADDDSQGQTILSRSLEEGPWAEGNWPEGNWAEGSIWAALLGAQDRASMISTLQANAARDHFVPLRTTRFNFDLPSMTLENNWRGGRGNYSLTARRLNFGKFLGRAGIYGIIAGVTVGTQGFGLFDDESLLSIQTGIPKGDDELHRILALREMCFPMRELFAAQPPAERSAFLLRLHTAERLCFTERELSQASAEFVGR